MELLLGADPELFVEKDGKFVSAHKMIPGHKQRPYKVEEGAVQVDGMALEFNINPARSEKEWLHSIDTVLSTLQSMIPKDHKISETATAYFDEEYMKAQPRKARMLGCEPDYNAYTETFNPRPDEKSLMRTAAGHIHLGWGTGMKKDKSHMEECFSLAKQLDYYLGVPSLLLDRDRKRREMYGQPGCFRPKSYGMEYRVLSNFWVMKDVFKSWVFRNTHMAFDKLVEDKGKIHPYASLARNTILMDDVKTCDQLLNLNIHLLPPEVMEMAHEV